MKKQLLVLASVAMAAILAVSCNQELSPSLHGSADGNALIAFKPVNGVTRAAIDGTTFPDARTMVVSAYYNATQGTSGNYFSGISFAKDGTTWAAEKYWPQTGTLDFLAYSVDGLSVSAAYSTNVDETVTLTVPDNSSTQTDILFSRADAQSYVASGVPMAFKHANALLVFTASSTVAYNATTNLGITINSITVNDAYYSGTALIDGSSVTWSSLGSQADVAVPSISSYNVPATALDVASAHMGIGGVGLMVPEQAQTSFTVSYTLHNGKDASDTALNTPMEFTYALSGDWEEGKKYVYELQFTLNRITVAPTVIDWNTQAIEVVDVIQPDPAPSCAPGDVAYYMDSAFGTASLADWTSQHASGQPLETATAVGVVVIPDNFLPDGQARIISLKGVNSDGSPSNSNEELTWSETDEDTELTNYTTVPLNNSSFVNANEFLEWTDNFDGTTIRSTYSYGGIPTEGSLDDGPRTYSFGPDDVSLTIRFWYDPSDDMYGDPVSFCPYNAEGTLNESFCATEYPAGTPIANPLSDFDGVGNTAVLTTYGTDNMAAYACSLYSTTGLAAGSWYLPAAGEACFILARYNTINATLSALSATTLTNDYWTSTEKSNSEAWFIGQDVANITATSKIAIPVRPFAHLPL